MASDDVKQYIDSNHDFYELLGVAPTCAEGELRSAWRKTALKYHPDKVGANQEALDKFHLLQIAYDVLSDSTARELYDNARRARVEKAQRESQYDARRKTMIDELEARESGYLKRKRDEMDEDEKFQRELARLAADGKRRREARTEELRRAAEAERKKEEEESAQPVAVQNGPVEEMDRSIKFRFPKGDETAHLDRDSVQELFSRFGKIEHTILRDKKVKVSGEKHRATYYTVLVVFKSIVGAHAAILDISKVQNEDPRFSVFEEVNWVKGLEPDCVPKAQLRSPMTPQSNGQNGVTPQTTHNAGTGSTTNGPSMEEMTMMRIKNAEKRRAEEKIRREKAEAGEEVNPPSTPGNSDRPQSALRAKLNASLNSEPGLRKVPSFGSFKGTPRASKGVSGLGSSVSSPSVDEANRAHARNAEKRRLEEEIRKEEAEAGEEA